MNAMVKTKVMDWSKRSAHQWLDHYGRWVRTTGFKVSAHPLAIMMNQNEIKRIKKSQISLPCEIEDFEAVKVSQLLSSMHKDSREYLSERAWLLILKYEFDWSYVRIAGVHGCSKATVRAQIDKGLAYLDGRIEVISEFDNESK